MSDLPSCGAKNQSEGKQRRRAAVDARGSRDSARARARAQRVRAFRRSRAPSAGRGRGRVIRAPSRAHLGDVEIDSSILDQLRLWSGIVVEDVRDDPLVNQHEQRGLPNPLVLVVVRLRLVRVQADQVQQTVLVLGQARVLLLLGLALGFRSRIALVVLVALFGHACECDGAVRCWRERRLASSTLALPLARLDRICLLIIPETTTWHKGAVTMVTTAQIRATTEARSGTQYGVLGPKAHAVWDPNGWEDRTRSYHRQRGGGRRARRPRPRPRASAAASRRSRPRSERAAPAASASAPAPGGGKLPSARRRRAAAGARRWRRATAAPTSCGSRTRRTTTTRRRTRRRTPSSSRSRRSRGRTRRPTGSRSCARSKARSSGFTGTCARAAAARRSPR